MIYCDNLNCEGVTFYYDPQALERVSDYIVIDGVVLCVACHELELDAQDELDANQPDYDYQLS